MLQFLSNFKNSFKKRQIKSFMQQQLVHAARKNVEPLIINSKNDGTISISLPPTMWNTFASNYSKARWNGLIHDVYKLIATEYYNQKEKTGAAPSQKDVKSLFERAISKL